MAEFLQGIEGMQRKIDEHHKRTIDGALKGTLAALQNVLRVSNRRVPHETGALERDGAAGLIATQGKTRGAVTYGRTGDTGKYAERQHEDMTLHHDGGRSAKFLEHAMAETRDQNLAIIQQAIVKETGA